jgi:lactoylglutathione lyase
MFVYVDNVDDTLAALRDADVRLLKGPQDMFWGERVAWVADPDGNPVALATAAAGSAQAAES